MSNIEKNKINIDRIQLLLDKLLDEVEQTIQEFKEDPVIDELQDKIGSYLFESKGFRALHLAYEVSVPPSAEKQYCLSSCLRHAGDKYLLEYFNFIDEVKRFIISKKPTTTSEPVEWFEWERAVRFADGLEQPVISELYERVQSYRTEIETLKEA